MTQAMTPRLSLIRKLEREIEDTKAKMHTWSAQFADNPATALKWADDVFQATSRNNWAQSVLYSVTSTELEWSLTEVANMLQERINQKARYPERSTAVCSNMVEREDLAAAAYFLDIVKAYANN